MKTIVTKFGGSSLANANQFKKVKIFFLQMKLENLSFHLHLAKDIQKILKLQMCYIFVMATLQSGIPLDDVFELISERYKSIVEELNIDLNIQDYLNIVKEDLEMGLLKIMLQVVENI